MPPTMAMDATSTALIILASTASLFTSLLRTGYEQYISGSISSVTIRVRVSAGTYRGPLSNKQGRHNAITGHVHADKLGILLIEVQ